MHFVVRLESIKTLDLELTLFMLQKSALKGPEFENKPVTLVLSPGHYCLHILPDYRVKTAMSRHWKIGGQCYKNYFKTSSMAKRRLT
jgi:hypothetical protein